MNNHFIEVNKLLGENIKNIINIPSKEINKRSREWNYMSLRKIFCDNLKAHGYDLFIDGSYISAIKNNEIVRFYFSAHSPQNKNYLVPSVLEKKVDYFAFYNNNSDVIYLVGYGIIREYCKKLDTAYIFYKKKNRQYLFIPDKWAQQQKINTMLLY